MALKEEKVPLTSGKKKASVRKETSAVSGMRVTIASKNQTHNAATLSEPSLSRGRSVSKRSIKGRSNPGIILRQPCRYLLFGRYLHEIALWVLASLPSVNFAKQKRDAKPRISVCSHIIRFDEQPNKKFERKGTIPKEEEKVTTRMRWLLWKLHNNWVASRKTQSHWNLKEAYILGETRSKKSWDQFDENDSHSSKLREASIREKKGPSLGKIQVKHPHLRSSYAVKFEDWSHEETERQQRCARSKAWNLAKNKYKLKEKDQVTFYSPAEEWVLRAASTNEPEEREFVVDSGASMHMVSKRNLNSAELETMRTSRSPTTVMTANGEVQTRKEAAVFCQRIGPIRDSYASWRNSHSSFFWEPLWGSWVNPPVDQRSKTTSHQKRQENW